MATDAPTLTPDPSGLPRTPDLTLAEPSPTTTPTPTPEAGVDLLTKDPKAPAEAPKPEAPAKAPEKYSDYKVPEGFTLDPAVKTKADALFKDFGLTQDQAQKAVDFYTEETRSAFEAPFQAYQDMLAKWREESNSHPDLRGKLERGQEINTRIAKALDAVGDPGLTKEFREIMDLSGVGNHSAFIRVFDWFAKQVTEGSHVAGRGPSPAGQSEPGKAPQSAAQALYPHLPSRTQ